MPPMRTKRCPCCEAYKPVAQFGRNRQAVDGLHYYCKLCAAARQRAWALAHPETVRAMRRSYLKRMREQNAGVNPYE
jgi:hypothetical protein